MQTLFVLPCFCNKSFQNRINNSAENVLDH